MRSAKIAVILLLVINIVMAVSLAVSLSPQAEEVYPTPTPFPVYETCRTMILGELPSGDFALYRLIKQGIVPNRPDRYKCVYHNIEIHH